MLTVLNSIELSTEYLEKKEVESPRTNAEILLAHILKCKRMDLYLRFDQPLKENEIIEYRQLIKRRGLREPVQYITGSVEFYGLELKVNSNVLIPRNETELLVEEVIKHIGKNDSLNILDIGTGSGNIAISLAKNLLNSQITSIDINSHASELAKQNADNNSIDGNLNILTADIRSFKLDNTHRFDLIISNPPYISSEDYKQLDPELQNYEPKNALTDDSDGLRFYELIASKSKDLLKSGGSLFFELGIGQSSKVKQFMLESGFEDINIIKDYQNIDRIIYGKLK